MTYQYIQTMHAVLSLLLGVIIGIVLLMPRKWRITLGLLAIHASLAYFMYLGVISMSMPIRGLTSNYAEYKYIYHYIRKNKKDMEIIAWLKHDDIGRLYVFPYNEKVARAFQKARENAKKGFPGKIIIKANKKTGSDIFEVKYRNISVMPKVPKK